MTETDSVEHVWRPEPVGDLRVTQVYGWLLASDGRVLVQDTGQRANLPGGRPEAVDGGELLATLRREALEESQVTVCDAVYLGFEQVNRDGVPVALVRMVGRIGEFLPRHPDPDGGRLLGRVLMPLAEAPARLEWGSSGTDQARAAGLVAEQRWGIPVHDPVWQTTVVP